jgi:CheY-like chemotaxis protein
MTRVLIVDDDDFILDIYARKFSREGVEVVSVHSGQEAIELLRKGEKYDGVLFDLLMPAYTGLDFLRDVRAEKLSPETAFLVLSNQGHQEDIDSAKSFGVDGYIVKASTVPSEVFSEAMDIIKKKQSNS